MTTLTISLSEEKLAQLKSTAKRLGVDAETLVRASIEDLLKKPEGDFKKSLDYVLEKNKELYRRLA